jgi:hypothetical protein
VKDKQSSTITQIAVTTIQTQSGEPTVPTTSIASTAPQPKPKLKPGRPPKIPKVKKNHSTSEVIAELSNEPQHRLANVEKALEFEHSNIRRSKRKKII